MRVSEGWKCIVVSVVCVGVTVGELVVVSAVGLAAVLVAVSCGGLAVVLVAVSAAGLAAARVAE